MEREAAEQVFRQLYDGWSGYALSHQDRRAQGVDERALTYGEVLFDGLVEVLEAATPASGECLVDLGSGTGRAVFAGCLAFPFARAIGIERLPLLAERSREVLARYDREVRPALPEPQRTQRIELRTGDFLVEDWSAADVVFAHASTFPPDLMTRLADRMATLRSGARVLCVGPRLKTPRLAPVRRLPIRLEWGSSTVGLYRAR